MWPSGYDQEECAACHDSDMANRKRMLWKAEAERSAGLRRNPGGRQGEGLGALRVP
jgi:hypothetical protein